MQPKRRNTTRHRRGVQFAAGGVVAQGQNVTKGVSNAVKRVAVHSPVAEPEAYAVASGTPNPINYGNAPPCVVVSKCFVIKRSRVTKDVRSAVFSDGIAIDLIKKNQKKCG